ncbi:hypothetical protein ACLOJK_014847 [Asimina triloba]
MRRPSVDIKNEETTRKELMMGVGTDSSTPTSSRGRCPHPLTRGRRPHLSRCPSNSYTWRPHRRSRLKLPHEANPAHEPPQRPPEETTDTVPVMLLRELVGMITLDAEGPITRADFSVLTELWRTLQQQLMHSWQ